MIGQLIGRIGGRGDDWVLVDVGGVGYHVDVSVRTARQLPADDEELCLVIETHVREDRIQLFGFSNDLERAWFRLLTSVQGVGTRMALAVLGALGPHDIAEAIALADQAMLTQTPGVGPKLAQKIILNLSDKTPKTLSRMPSDSTSDSASTDDTVSHRDRRDYRDALAVLTQLGYSPTQARQAIAASGAEQSNDTADLIKAALRKLTQSAG